jgi:colanic acid biosynthesis glycosyl transferase WcaI
VPLQTANSFRQELGLADKFVVLYAGNIGVKQALHIVLDAATRLSDEQDIVVVIAGDGPEKIKLRARYGHLPNVHFLPLQPEERLCELLNLADLHVLPQDGKAADLVLPSKLGGMLATGRDILVAADPGTELYDFLSGTATIVASGDSSAMAEAIRGKAKMGSRQPAAPHPLVFALDFDANLSKFARLLAAAT